MNITPKNILPVTKVKRDLMKLLRLLQADGEPVVITKDGKAAAVLVSSDEYESLLETRSILGNPSIMKSLRRSEASFQKGKSYSHKEVFDE